MSARHWLLLLVALVAVRELDGEHMIDPAWRRGQRVAVCKESGSTPWAYCHEGGNGQVGPYVGWQVDDSHYANVICKLLACLGPPSGCLRTPGQDQSRYVRFSIIGADWGMFSGHRDEG